MLVNIQSVWDILKKEQQQKDLAGLLHGFISKLFGTQILPFIPANQ